MDELLESRKEFEEKMIEELQEIEEDLQKEEVEHDSKEDKFVENELFKTNKLKKTLNKINHKEDDSEKTIKKIMVTEEELLKIVEVSKEKISKLIIMLQKYLKKYEFLKYTRLELERSKEEEKKKLLLKSNNHFMKGKGDARFSEKQHKKAQKILGKRLEEQDVKISEEGIQKSVVNLMRVNKSFEEMSVLIKQQIQYSEKELKMDEFIKKYVLEEYKQILEHYNYDSEISIEKELVQAFRTKILEEEHVENLNQDITNITKNLIISINKIRKLMARKEIQVFFKGYDSFSKKFLKKLDVFFGELLNKINNSEKLSQKLAEDEDEEIIEAEEYYDKFLKREANKMNKMK